MSMAAPVLLDCTRMVATRWLGRMPTGIDRVCDAYLDHFASRAQAVVQLRGHVRLLSPAQSACLFDLLRCGRASFRRGFAALAARTTMKWLDTAASQVLYLNVSHSDFDLDRHSRWVRSRAIRSVYMLHDLIPIENPEFTTPRKTARHLARVRRALEGATGIIANSHDTARSIADFANRQGLLAPPLLAAPLGAPILSSPLPRRPAARATFVCVSTIEHRKNHMLLLDVWQRLIAQAGESAPRLVLIGRWGVGGEAVRQRYRADPQLHRFVSIYSHLSDHDIARHMVAARALLAPSRAEGFGLPVAEALQLGVPVIASDLPAFRESGGKVPTFLDPASSEMWLRTIRDFVADGPERQRQLAALKAWRAPDWGDHFALVDDWLETLMNSSLKTSQPVSGVRCAANDAGDVVLSGLARAGELP